MSARLAVLPLAAWLCAGAAVAGQLNVREAPYAAKGDGKTDDTAAIQRALDDAARRGGGIVHLPAGRYLVATHLTVRAGTSLVGVGRAPMRYDPKAPGSMLLAVEGQGQAGGTPFITLEGSNAVIEGLAVYYPHQRVAATPFAYPWTVRATGENAGVINVMLVNPYQGVDLATSKAPRHNVQGLYGQPLYRGLWVDQCYDIGRVKNVHFWPFWSQDPKVIGYTTRNATGFIFQRTDWEVVDDIFVWGYAVGIELSASKSGGMNGQMTNVNLDNVDVGIDITETQPWVVHVSNLNIANDGAGERHIGIWGRPGQSGSAELTVRGASFWGAIHQAVRWENRGTLSLADSRIANWTGESPAIEILAGKALIHDNAFAPGRKPAVAFRAGEAAGAVSFHHNLLNGHTAGDARPDVSNNLP